MGKLLIISVGLVTLLSFSCPSYGHSLGINQQEMSMGTGDNILHRNTDGKIYRTQSLLFAEAFIDGRQLVIKFLLPVDCVTISVIHSSTGKVVYWDALEMPADLIIDLNNEENGDYEVKLSSHTSEVCGAFSL